MKRYQALKGFYELDRTIGCGGFAKVKLATHLATGEKVAIKIMDKSEMKDDLPRVKLELKALKTLSHPHICKLFQEIETETHYFIVVEYCSGGDLFDHIVEKTHLSEKQSRLFFRQIVSAVAYLHSLGYVHRDLKPENVLLDHSQNLKLIDFGLCAKPEGGMQNPLHTSCGSPTYAAPELVRGNQYLGPQVDVWAMGVLLFALMAGYLPFDDQNMDSLYKKIISGKYEEPKYMSQSSRNLVRQMLQTDPKKRISVQDLLKHPWLTLGSLGPVDIVEQNFKSKDKDILELMAQYHNADEEDMWRHLKRWRYDYDTATYMLLIARKKRGLPLKLLPGANILPIRVRSAEVIPIKNLPIHASNHPTKKRINKSDSTVDKLTPVKVRPLSSLTPSVVVTKCEDHDSNLTPNNVDLLSPDTFAEPRRPSSIRKPLKRIRSPNTDGEFSPVPTKRTPNQATPKLSEKKTPQGNEGSSARKALGSIERSLHKVRHVLTPKRTHVDNSVPSTLTNKDLCNVSTTQCSDPEFVITELTKALQKKGIPCERKGFTIRGKMEPNTMKRYGGCTFELEICYIPSMVPGPSRKGETPTKSKSATPSKSSKSNTVTRTNSGEFAIQKVSNKVGIRRKRLKGDSWCYKKVCEQVLALTATELRQESLV